MSYQWQPAQKNESQKTEGQKTHTLWDIAQQLVKLLEIRLQLQLESTQRFKKLTEKIRGRV